ncbi:hypothetical protein HW555_001496 [Spodoptera exigua]|uniref:Uncharacterized protein n=1 Tax=Spodoptera exigua TaxID=7107 RepID=A0A835GSZ6_SPOEX|nr:hypothetical protein HW555_001496 [Spodoptera exigua]
MLSHKKWELITTLHHGIRLQQGDAAGNLVKNSENGDVIGEGKCSFSTYQKRLTVPVDNQRTARVTLACTRTTNSTGADV